MTRKTLIMLVLAAFAGVFCLTGLLIAADAPDEVSIHEDVITKKLKGPVHLSHKKHNADYGVACADCHHKYEGGQNVWKEGDAVQKCGECHGEQDNKDTGAIKLKNAFHRNCQDCHKELEKAGKPTGPSKKCEDCHAAKQ